MPDTIGIEVNIGHLTLALKSKDENPKHNPMRHCLLGQAMEKDWGFQDYHVGIDTVWISKRKWSVDREGLKLIQAYCEAAKDKGKGEFVLSRLPKVITLTEVV